MLLTEKLETTRFSPTEQTLVNYILKERENIRSMTMKEMARATFTSPSLLSRIAEKVGYGGWEDCKRAYLEEITYLQSHFTRLDANYPFSPEDDEMTIAGKISELEREAIADTRVMLKADALHRATDMLEQAEEILIFSTNHFLVKEFKRNMGRIRKRVEVIEHEAEMSYLANYATERTCGILISYSGESERYITAARILREKGIPTISLTNLGNNSIASLAECNLYICTREKLHSKIAPYSTDISVIYLLDTLYSCCLARNYRDNLERRDKITRTYEKGRTSTTEALREDT